MSKITKGLKIILDMDLIRTYHLTPTMYCILYYLYHNLDCNIGSNMHNKLHEVGMLEKDEIKLTANGKKLFYEDPKQWSSDRLKKFLNELREHFPKGVKIGGNPVRTTIGDSTINKMKNFFKEYDYSTDIIIEATKGYVEERKQHNYAYMKKFTNFINKQGDDSTLASWCEMVENGEVQGTRSVNDYNIKLD